MENDEGLSALKNEIRKEAKEQAAKGLLLGIVLLLSFALTGWWFYLKDKIVSLASGVGSGAVMAFDIPSGCPEGWTEFSDASGMVIVGVGKAENLSQRNYRDTGGSEKHALTRNELASHSHGFSGDSVEFGGWGGSGNFYKLAPGNTAEFEESHTPSGSIELTGESRPHENMPPFIVLHYCRKI